MANVPVMITDAEPSHDLGSTTTAAEESSEEPAYVLPAGYQEIPVQANAVYNGTLVLVNAANPSHLGADELELEQVYYADDRQDTYEISYPGHTSLNKGALAKFNRLMRPITARLRTRRSCSITAIWRPIRKRAIRNPQRVWMCSFT
jgi:hypothetical protein